ncbi:hypothetical protein H6775_01665 [Candidatus Nomurabacteria bacterium]|nr:hypothetical protein [Candidatus Nomurabacteria bacterium]
MKNLNFKIKKLFKKQNKGFTLLFAVLVSVLVLAVGASIISIALKQVILSGAGRDSQFAFYASNTGLECALYWDLHPNDNGGTLEYVFPANFPSQSISQTEWADDAAITCLGGEIRTGDGFDSNPFTDEVSGYDWDTANNTFKFRLAITNNIDDPNNDPVNDILYCVEVTITKEYDSGSGSTITNITSQGLNTCDPENNPRAIERGLVLRYES